MAIWILMHRLGFNKAVFIKFGDLQNWLLYKTKVLTYLRNILFPPPFRSLNHGFTLFGGT